MTIAMQPQLRKYQLLRWIHGLEQGWKARAGVAQPPTVANIAAHMLKEEVFPAGVEERYTNANRKLGPRGPEACRFLKRHLNRLCTNYRSNGLLTYFSPADRTADDETQPAYTQSDQHTLTRRDGAYVVQKTPQNHLDLKKSWATRQTNARILRLTDWGRIRASITEHDQTGGPAQPPAANTALEDYFAAKQALVEDLSFTPATDTVSVPQEQKYTWTPTELTAPRIEVLTHDGASLLVRDLDTNATERVVDPSP